MNGWIVALIVLGALVLEFVFLYLIAIKPDTSRKKRMDEFAKRYVAHRGLFDAESPENTLAAFRKAVRAGYGIELDVQLTRDKQAVVFHDCNLKRMTGVDKNLSECDYAELLSYPVGGTKERIPLFADVLREIGGAVPLIVEIKVEDDYYETTKAAAELLDGYEGLYCVESFHPFSLVWYRKNRPDVLRGQLATDLFSEKSKQSFGRKFVLTHMLLNLSAKPDFIAYDHRYAGNLPFSVCRNLYGAKTAAWTVQDEETLEKCRKKFDVMIFDSFVPSEKD